MAPHRGEQLLENVSRVHRVKSIFWCSEPFNEAGQYLRHISPRSLMRIFRKLKHQEGPSGGEVGHSYAVVELEMVPGEHLLKSDAGEKIERLETESFRLNWGQGIKHGSCLTIFPGATVPPCRITGERCERQFTGTCSGAELIDLLRKWSPREYDVNPMHQRNCHHFVQDIIQQCTIAETGYRE